MNTIKMIKSLVHRGACLVRGGVKLIILSKIHKKWLVQRGVYCLKSRCHTVTFFDLYFFEFVQKIDFFWLVQGGAKF